MPIVTAKEEPKKQEHGGTTTAGTASVLFQNYKRGAVAFARGEGSRLFDAAGNEYLDFLAGIATSSLGHAHPRLLGALAAQASRVIHVSNLFEVPEQEEAARRLVAASRINDHGLGLDRAFFCNSGTEANEALIKLARRFATSRGEPERVEIVSTERGFHGRTLGALAATGTPSYHEGFQPLPRGFSCIPFGDIAAMDRAIGERTAGVLIEAVQGEGGVFPAAPEYLREVARLCRERGALLLLDEVQTGIGRLGERFGFHVYGVAPDAIALAKGLGGGVPVGAVLAREEIAAVFVPGSHGTTFGGNPLAMAAVVAVQRALEEDGVLDNVRAVAPRLRAGLERLVAEEPTVASVRGIGLMQAIELEPSVAAAEVASRALRLSGGGLVVNAVRPHTIRILPPLVISAAEIDEGLERLHKALRG